MEIISALSDIESASAALLDSPDFSVMFPEFMQTDVLRVLAGQFPLCRASGGVGAWTVQVKGRKLVLLYLYMILMILRRFQVNDGFRLYGVALF